MASSDNNPWAWLGLLKWSLSYSDGTSPSSASPMSEEDRAFLEAVMREGIIDENERMKEILKQVTEACEKWKNEEDGVDEDEVQDLLRELRDIVEQIDYARAFGAMKGLPFLLGCASEQAIPRSVRNVCLGILATMSQHNPPVQKELLEIGAIRILSEVYFSEDDGKFKAKIIQAMSANVRSHELAESVFCGVEQARQIIEYGVQDSELSLRKRAVFFLRALITSDSSSLERVRLFEASIRHIADNFLNDEDTELREMSLALLDQILEQKKSVNTVLDRKEAIAALGVQRVAAIRALTGEERDYASMELEHWESLLVHLARASTDPEPEVAASAPLMIAAGSANPDRDALPQ